MTHEGRNQIVVGGSVKERVSGREVAVCTAMYAIKAKRGDEAHMHGVKAKM